MKSQGFAVFETTIGPCGIVWGAEGVVGTQLPVGSASRTRAEVAARFPEASEGEPPPPVRSAVEGIVALLRGERTDLSDVPLDMRGVPPFHRRVYELARTIPAGETLSYGDVATRLGSAGAARAVGQALGRNPFAIVVPCHRVLAAGGKMGGFTADGGVETKRRILAVEAPKLRDSFEGDGAFGFDPAVAVAHLRETDPRLGELIQKVGPFGMQLKITSSLHAALAESIVYQQLTGKAAATIYGRVCALFPNAHEGPTPKQILRASDEKLRGAGLSRNKVLALRDLARRAEAGEIPTLAEAHGMDDEALIERLTAVRGIGRWTVEMLLMFRLARPDVLPVDDYGIRKGFSIVFGTAELPKAAELSARGARWAPYRTVASWYLWRALDAG